MSKGLANRLKGVLDKVISAPQNAFVGEVDFGFGAYCHGACG